MLADCLGPCRGLIQMRMSTDVRVTVAVRRERAVVAAFMFEPENDPIWTSGVVAVRPAQPGRLRVGSRVERTSRFLGREFSYEYEVIEAEPERLVVMRVEKPFPMLIRYELEVESGSETHVTIHARGDAGGFYRLAAPLLERMVRRNIENDLAALEAHLEASHAGSERGP